MSVTNFGIRGLSDTQVTQSREAYGSNTLTSATQRGFLRALKTIMTEPMVLLLLVASAIYFISGNPGDGIFLASAIVLVGSISLYQDSRSRKAMEKLKSLSQPNCSVIRNGEVVWIPSREVVVGDYLMVEEGTLVAADGIIVHSNDFSVNESMLTGESLSVFKDADTPDNEIFTGTSVVSGLAVARVTTIGNNTRLGQIGKSIESVQDTKTPLESQINNFVKNMSIWGGAAFLLVWGINYKNSGDVLGSLLKALTLAMSILPEEIPVAFTTFMALGSWRLMKLGIVVKEMKTVEALGSATVICTDKTGTITQNKMSLAKLFTLESGSISDPATPLGQAEVHLVTLAMWASEPIPFDPMELALHAHYFTITDKDLRPDYHMIHEYPLGGKPPMMTHIFESSSGDRIIAAKGAPEAFFDIAELSANEQSLIQETIKTLGREGYRLLGVGRGHWKGTAFPVKQQDIPFEFMGIVAFYDPPKENIRAVLREFDKAGIIVKLVTGDNADTATAIAKEIEFIGSEKCISGDELMQLRDSELREKVKETQVFSRMFPEAKLRIINALKANNEVVAMIGDGVNDGPALKAAHFGIAMGKKGTEIAKRAASMILVDDDLSRLVNAIAMGRKIYTNLKKAVQYIISIHIPIILCVFIPLALGWQYPTLFSPPHIIILELIMGPTCSIIYENEPMEKNTMIEKPRPLTTKFFRFKELATSIVQGLVISLMALGVYQYAVHQGLNESTTRTMVFMVLISANIFLTLVNRSFTFSMITTLKYKNKLVPLIIGITVLMSALLLYVPSFTTFLGFQTLTLSQLALSGVAGCISVVWLEIKKWIKRMKRGIGDQSLVIASPQRPGHRHPRSRV